MKAIYSIICFFCCTTFGIAQNTSFEGTFVNQPINLIITLSNNNGSYSGQFGIQGQTYPLTAQLTNQNILVGSYPYFGNSVPIQLMEVANEYILITEGVTLPVIFTAQNKESTSTEITQEYPRISNEKPANSGAMPVSIAPNTLQKANGRSFSDVYTGYQFNIPKDWVGQSLEDGSGGYLIGHNTKPGFILIMPHDYTSLAQIRQLSLQGIQEEDIHLYPTSDIQTYGENGLIAAFGGEMEGQTVKAHSIALLSPFGGGLSMTIAVRSDLYQNNYLPILQSIANTATFSTPKTSPVASQWNKRIKGKRLLYLNTSNGFSDKITIDLCSNGQFGYGSNSSGMSTGPTTLTYAGQDAGQGTWKVINRGQIASLILNYTDGEVGEYPLSNGQTDGQIQLNGRRYFIQNGERCN